MRCSADKARWSEWRHGVGTGMICCRLKAVLFTEGTVVELLSEHNAA